MFWDSFDEESKIKIPKRSSAHNLSCPLLTKLYRASKILSQNRKNKISAEILYWLIRLLKKRCNQLSMWRFRASSRIFDGTCLFVSTVLWAEEVPTGNPTCYIFFAFEVFNIKPELFLLETYENTCLYLKYREYLPFCFGVPVMWILLWTEDFACAFQIHLHRTSFAYFLQRLGKNVSFTHLCVYLNNVMSKVLCFFAGNIKMD